MSTLMRRAAACLTALVSASSSSRTICTTCHGLSSGCSGRPCGTACQSSAMSCGRSCAMARSRQDPSASIRSPPMSSIESITRRRSFSAARAASPIGDAGAVALAHRHDADELAAEPVMQVAHQPGALARQRRGARPLLLAGETGLQLVLGLAHQHHHAAREAVDLIERAGKTPGQRRADGHQHRRVGQAREEDAPVGHELQHREHVVNPAGQHDRDGAGQQQAGDVLALQHRLAPRSPPAARDRDRRSACRRSGRARAARSDLRSIRSRSARGRAGR